MRAPPKRKFIRAESAHGDLPYNDEIVYLVYSYETDKLTSDGPFSDEQIAIKNMRKLLLDGICAWIVSYNG